MIKAAVLGATGYAGIELVRLLSNHPEVEIKFLGSQSFDGKKIRTQVMDIVKASLQIIVLMI